MRVATLVRTLNSEDFAIDGLSWTAVEELRPRLSFPRKGRGGRGRHTLCLAKSVWSLQQWSCAR
jgi:hypothetical protein